MYINEISIYCGRKLSQSPQDIENFEKISYGIIADDRVQSFHEVVIKILHEDDEIAKLSDIASKAQKKFLKSRMSASNSSLKESKTFDFHKPHPSFSNDSNLVNIELIKAFKPKVSYLQWKKNKNPNSEEAKAFTKIVDRFKRNEKKPIIEDKEAMEDIESDIDEYTGETENKPKKKMIFMPKKEVKSDFKDPKFFISNKPNPKGCSLFGEDGKINQEEITAFHVKDPDEEVNTQGQFMWDKKKKKFIKSQGKRSDKPKGKDSEKKFEAQNKYKKWRKSNSIGFQKEGELESRKNTNTAKRLFSERRKMVGYKSKSKAPKVQNELRNFDQILKGKKQEAKRMVKNAPKLSRGKKISKNRNKKY